MKKLFISCFLIAGIAIASTLLIKNYSGIDSSILINNIEALMDQDQENGLGGMRMWCNQQRDTSCFFEYGGIRSYGFLVVIWE